MHGHHPEDERLSTRITLALEKAEEFLNHGDLDSAETSLKIIPHDLIQQIADPIVIEFTILAEDEGDQKSFFNGLKILSKLIMLWGKKDFEKGAFQIWTADHEEIAKYWGKVIKMRKYIKNEDRHFFTELYSMKLYDLDACVKLSNLYSIVLLHRLSTDKDNIDLHTNFALQNLLTETLIKRQIELKKAN